MTKCPSCNIDVSSNDDFIFHLATCMMKNAAMFKESGRLIAHDVKCQNSKYLPILIYAAYQVTMSMLWPLKVPKKAVRGIKDSYSNGILLVIDREV